LEQGCPNTPGAEGGIRTRTSLAAQRILSSAWTVENGLQPSPPYLGAAPLVCWRLLSSARLAVKTAVSAGSFRDVPGECESF
jgi:hypothetical protein